MSRLVIEMTAPLLFTFIEGKTLNHLNPIINSQSKTLTAPLSCTVKSQSEVILTRNQNPLLKSDFEYSWQRADAGLPYRVKLRVHYINPIARKSIRSRILQKIRRIADAGIRKSYESRAQSENYSFRKFNSEKYYEPN